MIRCWSAMLRRAEGPDLAGHVRHLAMALMHFRFTSPLSTRTGFEALVTEFVAFLYCQGKDFLWGLARFHLCLQFGRQVFEIHDVSSFECTLLHILRANGKSCLCGFMCSLSGLVRSRLIHEVPTSGQ